VYDYRRAATRVLPWLREHRLQLLALFVGVLIPLGVFGLLAGEVLDQESFSFDEPLLLFFHQRATPGLNSLMLAFSLLGYQYGVIPGCVMVLLLLLRLQRWGDALFWGLATGGAGALNLLAKQLFGRIRPDLWLSIAPESTYSFPSGHAMGSMAFVAALVVLAWPTAWRWFTLALGGVFALFVGVSRVYLGVHFPSDIIAGWAAACAWVFGVSMVLYGHAVKPYRYAEPTAPAASEREGFGEANASPNLSRR
jgi:undecaprenyl-diphosphatase